MITTELRESLMAELNEDATGFVVWAMNTKGMCFPLCEGSDWISLACITGLLKKYDFELEGECKKVIINTAKNRSKCPWLHEVLGKAPHRQREILNKKRRECGIILQLITGKSVEEINKLAAILLEGMRVAVAV